MADTSANHKHNPEHRWDFFLFCIVLLAIAVSLGVYFIHSFHIFRHSCQSEQSTFGSRPIFNVESMNVSSFNVSGSQITGNWDIGIRIDNNSTSNLNFDNVHVFVSYKEQLLSQSQTSVVGLISVAPFKYTTFQAKLLALHKIDNRDVAASIINDWAQEAVDFDVKLLAAQGNTGVTSVDCGDIKLKFSADSNIGTMLGDSTLCEVHQQPVGLIASPPL